MARPNFILVLAIFAMQPVAAHAAPTGSVQANIDLVWVTVAAGLVLLMQIGFLLLESGLVRTKNTINVAQKNLSDFMVSGTAFGAVGFMIMFGSSSGLWGADTDLLLFPNSTPESSAFLVFQIMFCGTAATIVSGAIAERTSFSGYLVAIPCIAIIIYPVAGHWAWGNWLDPDNPAWLAAKGFIDFAGSTVVHSVGGWIALAALLVVGPRIGRYDADGKPTAIQHHNLFLSSAGALLLFVGWLGFNGGSTLQANSDVAKIIANTVVAGICGGTIGLIIGRALSDTYQPMHTINGVLGGLVAVTAGCAVLTTDSAALVGGLGAIVAAFGCKLLDHFQIDDAISAVPVHGFAGATGTIALALFAPAESLALPRMEQLGVQALGVGVIFLWTFPAAFLLFKVIDLTIGLRVTENDERLGLNSTEHGAKIGLDSITERMQDLIEGDGSLLGRIDVEPGDEAADLASLFNRFLGQLSAKDAARELKDADIKRADREMATRNTERLAETEERNRQQAQIAAAIRDTLDRVDAGQLDVRINTTCLSGIFGTIGDGLNRLLEHTEGLADSVAARAVDLKRATDGMSSLSGNMSQTATEQHDAVTIAVQDVKGVERQVVETRTAINTARNVSYRTVEQTGEGNTAASQARIAVEEMAVAAREIRGVIDEISGISQKTNLIAINAGVEASRTGAGKTFFVIAKEVRALALSAGQMSDRISKILSNTEEKVALCAESIGRTSGALDDIAAGARETQSAMDHIARFAADQAEACADLTKAVARIEEGATRNMRTAESLSGAARDVKNTAACLNSAVNEIHNTAAQHSIAAE